MDILRAVTGNVHDITHDIQYCNQEHTLVENNTL